MPKIVESPVTRKGSKVSGNIPGFSPGAFSNPSRGNGDSVPPKPAHGTTARHAEEHKGGEVKIAAPRTKRESVCFLKASRGILLPYVTRRFVSTRRSISACQGE
jgi:hypothetical protein